MQNISYEQIIAVLAMSVWFIFPFGMFLSVMKQDRESLPSPKHDEKEHLKIFEHKKMIYNDEAEAEDVEISDDIELNPEESSQDREFNHPHTGIGSTHVHHIH